MKNWRGIRIGSTDHEIFCGRTLIQVNVPAEFARCDRAVAMIPIRGTDGDSLESGKFFPFEFGRLCWGQAWVIF